MKKVEKKTIEILKTNCVKQKAKKTNTTLILAALEYCKQFEGVLIFS